MRPICSQPVFPATVLAAAVMLSITSAADVTVAAVLMNAGRQVPARAMADAESLSQWLSRFADAARQIRDVFGGDETGASASTYAVVRAGHSIVLSASPVGVVELDPYESHFSHPLLHRVTDLPPPSR